LGPVTSRCYESGTQIATLFFKNICGKLFKNDFQKSLYICKVKSRAEVFVINIHTWIGPTQEYC